ncbi:Acyl-CoA reductase [Burkholderiales bacterium 8X]|nr:Acyl-CoA reductase [Burkholderiales bacterium 8X]
MAEASLTESVRCLIDGEWIAQPVGFTTVDPYRDEVVAEVPDCDEEVVTAAVSAAVGAAKKVAATPARERAVLLKRMAAAVRQQASDIANVMCLETGKPIADCQVEVLRSADTLELSADEAVRLCGELIPMESSAIGAGKLGFTLRDPVGVVAAITPFNAPVNLCAHKIGPAIGAGNAVVLKPAPQASATIHRFVRALQDAQLPRGWLNVVYGHQAGATMVEDPRVRFISFTGSSAVGKLVSRAAGLRRVALELGGNGNTVVCEDARVDEAATICARNAMRLAGQSCISVQNIWVHESRVDAFVQRMVAVVRELRTGDPLDPRTEVGTVISRQSAERIHRLVQAAIGAGAEVLCGNRQLGAVVDPTVLRNTPIDQEAVAGEVFGPVANVLAFRSTDEVVEAVNRGPFGLQAGVFTESMRTGLALARELEMGAVIVNGSSTWRSDQAPYGGVKDSGIGREGPKYAMREMTNEKMVVFNI